MSVKKIITALFLGSILLTPNLVLAQTVLPDFNPVCWTKKECVSQRSKMFQLIGSEAEAGFFPNEGGCSGTVGDNEDDIWGKCLPGTVAKTSIGIGGKTSFTNIGDYIATVYYHALGIVGVVAVLVIIVAGVQWIMSAGNSAVIGEAKKRIGGALIGLFLAYSSFFILNSINPWLTKFRLPKVWMVKEVNMMAEFCTDVQNIDKAPGIKFALIADPKNGVKKEIKDIKEGDYFQVFNNKEDNIIGNGEKLICNQTFVAAGGAGATCQGNYCGSNGGLCLKMEMNTETSNWEYDCEDTIAGGRVFGTYFLEPGCLNFGGMIEGYVKPYITSGSKLLLVCADNYVHEVGDIKVKDIPGSVSDNLWYVEGLQANNVDGKIESMCGGIYRGFILKLYLDEACDASDEIHLVGGNGNDMGVISRTGHTITSVISSLIPGGMSLESYIYNDSISELKGEFDKSYFITREQLKNGFRLNINVYNIPDID